MPLLLGEENNYVNEVTFFFHPKDKIQKNVEILPQTKCRKSSIGYIESYFPFVTLQIFQGKMPLVWSSTGGFLAAA